MKTKLLMLLSVLLFTASISLAQKRFTDGYIVNYNNDTIRGQIKDRGVMSQANYNRIRFIDSAGKKSKFSAKKIKAYSKQNVLNYRSINHKWFGEVIEDGDVILLARTKMRRVNGNSGFAGGHTYTTGNAGYTVAQTIYYIKYKNQGDEYERVKMLFFASNFAPFFKQCPEVQKLVETQSLVYNDLKVIVRKYNECVSKSNK